MTLPAPVTLVAPRLRMEAPPGPQQPLLSPALPVTLVV